MPPDLQGIDRATAQRIMEIWRKSGAVDPETLRKVGGGWSGRPLRPPRPHLCTAATCRSPDACPALLAARGRALVSPPARLQPRTRPPSAAARSSPLLLHASQLFLKRSLSKSSQIALQLLIDGASGAGAYYAARSITPEQLGTWSLTAKWVGMEQGCRGEGCC